MSIGVEITAKGNPKRKKIYWSLNISRKKSWIH